MADYKMVKYCMLCRKKFFAQKGESKRIYCDVCEKRVREQARKEQEAEDAAEAAAKKE